MPLDAPPPKPSSYSGLPKSHPRKLSGMGEPFQHFGGPSGSVAIGEKKDNQFVFGLALRPSSRRSGASSSSCWRKCSRHSDRKDPRRFFFFWFYIYIYMFFPKATKATKATNATKATKAIGVFVLFSGTRGPKHLKRVPAMFASR